MSNLIRATTPTHYFRTTIDPDGLKRILVTYKQNKRVVLEKEKSDLTITSEVVDDATVYTMSFKMTQGEANRFRDDAPIYVQVRILTNDGAAAASKIFALDGETVLNDEVLT